MAPQRTNHSFANYVLLRKCSNVENFPPRSFRQFSLSMKAPHAVSASSAKFAVRRRRHRAAHGISAAQRAVEHAARRRHPSHSSTTTCSQDVEMGDATPSPSGMTTFNLPRVLERPALKEITKEALAAIEPRLADMPLEYIQDGLKAVSETMLKVLRGIRTEPISGALPPKMSVVVDDLSRDMPTHMLAVWSRQPTTAATRVTLYPTHHLVLAAHCATLPPLPPSRPAAPAAAGATLTLPVVPLGLPHAPSFPRLHTFLYTKDAAELLGSLLPALPPARPSDERDVVFFARYSVTLAATFSPHALLGHALVVNGLWRNACALGIFDRGLWRVIDLAWAILLDALAIGSGQGAAVLGAPRV